MNNEIIPVPTRCSGNHWVCEKHGETNRTMSLLFDGKVTHTYCLDCYIEAIGLPNIEPTRHKAKPQEGG